MVFRDNDFNITDIKAFEELFFDYYGVLCAVADRFLDNEQESKDIAQEAFLRLWRKREQFSNIISVKSYLYTIVKNLCLNAMRTNSRTTTSSFEALSDPDYDLEPVIIREEAIFILRHAIEKLPPRTRKIMDLALCGMKNQEIADEMGISVNTVKTLKYKAIENLRKDLQDRYPTGKIAPVLLILEMLLAANI